ncbi:ribonuclease H2 subunit B [Tetranychus urticae]|uniref:Ribonuclease H2 subunit B n=1 Tax=Tetranychus urticae TaxID=32264 RepID=T1KF69_TETUR|nr:ribonuclease H2 subunit B [Tetranychus urticae]
MTSEDRDYKVITLPRACLGKKLKSFKFGKDGSYLFDAEYSNVYEVVEYKEQNRSWFMGDIVIKDGSLLMITRVDPLFLILPCLIENKQVFATLQGITEENTGASTLIKALIPNEREIMSSVAETKDFEDEIYYRLDEKKLMIWLKAKVKNVVKCLKAIGVDVSQKSNKVNKFVSGRQEETNEKDYIIYALNLLAKYLHDDHLKALQETYNVKINAEPEPESKATPKGTKRSFNETKTEKCEPIENYYSTETHTNGESKKVKMSRSQKELQQAANKSGVRKISQFFKKK